MRQLILIRHSNAESGSFSMSDFDRKLTPKGIVRAKYQAEELKIRGIVPNLIISSSAVRALETTDIFVDVFRGNCTIQKESFLYEDYTTGDFFNLLNSIENTHSVVLLIGHNPNISTMAYRLCSDISVSFRPCEMVNFNINDNWNTLQVGGGEINEDIAP